LLVAQRQQYEEPYYPQPVEREEAKLEPNPRVLAKPKKKPHKKVLHLAIVLVGFALCSYTVGRFAMIAEKQQEILALEQALEKQQTIQEYMKLELAARGDLNRIEEFAKNDLGMDYPNKEQVLFVELPERVVKEIADTSTEAESKDSIWSKIVGLLD